MNIVIDIGNSRMKAALFEHGRMWRYREFRTLPELNHWLSLHPADNLLLASVGHHQLAELSTKHVRQLCLQLSHQTPLPLNIHYQTPHTLGVDRIAAVVGARCFFPEHAVLVVDLGSCITYDLADAKGNYWGGAIAPGLNMRLKVMHEQTARLPAVSWDTKQPCPPLVGSSTLQAMQSGAVHGILAEITYFASTLQKEYTDLKLVLCGGDALYFKKYLDFCTFAEPKLVLIGLNRILEYNADLQTK